jgi:sarcosine oxidase subunit alpha
MDNKDETQVRGSLHEMNVDQHPTVTICMRRNSLSAAGASRMSDGFSITVNGKSVRVRERTSIAAAVIMANEPSRFSVTGEARAPLCGMGICMECRATVNGVAHVRTCQVDCAPDMEVVTG